MMRGGFSFISFSIIIFFFFFSTVLSTSSDILSSNQSLSINESLISSNGIFKAGFVDLSGDSKYYFGIWYNNIDIQTVFWIANRDSPLENSNGFLKIGNTGTLEILNQSNSNTIWSSNQTSTSKPENPVLQILDSGNLILRESTDTSNTTNPLWQSFDFPTDTLIPGMKIEYNFDNKSQKSLTSWNSNDDPSSGNYSFKLDYHGLPEIYLYGHNSSKIYRSGPWNGIRFSGVPEMEPEEESINFIYYQDSHRVYYTFTVGKNESGSDSLLTRLIVTSSGYVRRMTWVNTSSAWSEFWYSPEDQCDDYKVCGPYGMCDVNSSPVCECVKGFKPKNQEAWDLRDGSDGCVRKTRLDCVSDGFQKVENVKLPETEEVYVNISMSLSECEVKCKGNCSCTAYSNLDIKNGGKGCVMWGGDLLDIRTYTNGGQDLYIKLAASDLESSGGSNKAKKIAIGVTVPLVIILLGLVLYFLWKRRKSQSLLRRDTRLRVSWERSHEFLMHEGAVTSTRRNSGERNIDELELPLFDFDTITIATDNFSQENKLGEGGFGSVYRGRLMEGQEIAVKRLSRNSGQGAEEFKTEVKLIAKLQHRNLVRLFGCCVEKDERILVYEYMENRSLDSILFDTAKRTLLDWQKRFNIICGIARGLLYLHQDSRFRIIHRDLKASNILLDREMNPKISDFGMARIFGADQTEANTVRVVGTYGYMSPEYAMDGVFSVKSDVFSFGVLVLEIITGKKNRGFYNSNNLLELAWMHWKEGKALELTDSSFGDSYSPSEFLRCIHVGLLCVQERAEDRPTMSTVVLMLNSESTSMPQPRSPGFCLARSLQETDSSSSKKDESYTINNVTVTMLDAR